MALPSKETRRVVKGPHLWVITVLMAILIVGYYSNYVDISSWIPFGKQFFTAEYARDLHRALFLIPMLYAAIVFHFRGALVVSFIFFLVVLPRGLFISPHPDPMLRAVIFIVVASAATILLGLGQDQREKEKALAKFPSEDPYPVLRVSREGIIVYANQGSLPVLNTWGCQTGQPLPEYWRKLSLDVLNSGSNKEYEIECEGRIFSITFAPVADADYLNLYGLDITESRRAAEELQQSRQRLVSVQESLRKEIAQELHGAVQNRLIVLIHRLKELEQTVPRSELAVELESLRQKLEELLESHVRPISHRLFPSILRRGLIPALQSLGDHFEATLVVDMKLDEKLVRQERDDHELVPEQLRLAIYRIAEEALINVVKHAKAGKVTIESEWSPGEWLRLMVSDDGQGFDMDSTSAGLGLVIMQDYAKVSGGRCIIHSAPGEGTEVTATLPLAGLGGEHTEIASSLE